MDDPGRSTEGSTCVSDLEGAELDAAVARAEGENIGRTSALHGGRPFSVEQDGNPLRYSAQWKHGGPIIQREQIAIWWEKDYWNAAFGLQLDVRSAEHSVVWMNCEHWNIGPTPLIAAMRAYVASKSNQGMR